MNPDTIPPLPDGFDAAKQFPILKSWTFFNHGGVSPISAAAGEALRTYIRQSLNDAYLKGNWYAQTDAIRALAAKLIGAHADEIAFVKNTSEGLAFVANGLEWHSEDEIVSTAVEYPANVYPWMDLAKRFGVKHVMVPEHDGRIDTAELLQAITPKTRLVALSHVEYGSGFRNDVAAIGRHCRERGVLFCVDAIQSVGMLPVDVQAMNIDFLSADGHKWLVSTEGCGIFYCRRELLDKLHPEVGWWNVVNATDYEHFDFTLRSDAQRFECGTFNIPGILALGASIRMLQEVGIDLISRRVLALTDYLCERLPEKGYRVFSSRKPGESSAIVSFTSSSHDEQTVLRDLKRHKVVIAPRYGRLRASPHFYNSAEQIDAMIEALP